MMARILIVDDSALSRRILRRILETDRHEVAEADSGYAALQLHADLAPDLVFTDLVMDAMYGSELLSLLRKRQASAKVVIATADTDVSAREAMQSEGAFGFVDKPFDPEAVLQAVHEALDFKET
jgi:two-component system chemotaxis response regulator CheY